jgi:endonuclease/exonuclease/phosphatase family metal-dependent hydrolase
VLFILLCTAHAFAYTYPYTLSGFEGAELPTFYVALAIVCVAAIWAPRADAAVESAPLPGRSIRWIVVGVLAWVVAGIVALPRVPRLLADVDSVRLGTYNIHYGFDAHWRLTLEEQARTIAESDAHLVALQEVDTGRLTSFGVDDALWLGRRLRMDVIYLPTVEHNTGIALLSRLKIEESESTLLPSDEEPTGIVRVTVSVGGAPLRAHGIWLGLSPAEREQQLAAALAFIGEGRATLAGDLNATPDSAVYATMIAEGYTDPFVSGGFPAELTSPAIEPQERIDYVWLRGLQPSDARVLDSLASDHRMVIVEAR